jgi:Cell wall-associated hydrolases (invasion-associated proteins)
MLMKNCRKIGKGRLREGDLVFFSTGNKAKAYVNHVGIYLKTNKFLHASTSKGVIVSDLDEPYYMRAWACGGRVE